MKKTLVTALLFTVLSERISAQSYSQQRSEVFFVNILSNAVIGGVGGAINKGKDEKVYRAFLRNFLKGGAGGLVKYTAKYQTYYLASPVTSVYAPINRLYYFLGHSMVMNASLNRKVLDTYYCNFYGVDLRFKRTSEQKIHARLSLATLASAVYFGTKGFELDFYRSLEYGQLMFQMKPGQLGIYNGMAWFNCIVLQSRSNVPDLAILPHETIHTYQAYDYFGIASFYDQNLRSWYKDKKLYNLLSKYVVLDYEALFMSVPYALQFHPMPDYYKNYFEFEAEHFKTRQYIKR